MNFFGDIGLLLRRLARKLRRDGPREVTLRRFDGRGCRFAVATPMDSFRIERYGDEEEFTALILAEVQPGDVLYDIGACVGLVTVHAARKGAQVIAFEPDPGYRARLEENLRLNRLLDVQVLPWAVADRPGEMTLYTDGAGGNSPSLRKLSQQGMLSVAVDSLDSALARGELPAPDLIKLDIEGAEILALHGMGELLRSNRGPRLLFVEIHPLYLQDYGSSTAEVEQLLSGSGYQRTYQVQRSQQIHAIYRKAR